MSWFYIWDIFPILAIAALLIAFLIKRKAMKEEETELKETLDSLLTKDGTDDNQ
ncbi:MAG: hypothetical protein Q4A65_03245 [Bacillota bacterium]|nr:hypothetical protein [Bacillota bacterium]